MNLSELSLTAQEIEMIKLKREQEENAAKQKAVAQQILKDKEIEKVKSNIEKFIELQKRKNEWAKTSVVKFNSLNKDGNQYELIKVDRDKVFECYEYSYAQTGSTKNIYFTETVKYTHIAIHPIGFGIKDNYQSFDIYITDDLNFNWKSKVYRAHKTLNEKIMHLILDKQIEKTTAEKLESARETVKATLQEKYFDATLEYKQEYIRSTYKYMKSYYANSYILTFPNGLQVQFKYNENGIISNGVIKNMSDFNVDSIIDFCRTLSKQTNK
jgi:hypothetical protein